MRQVNYCALIYNLCGVLILCFHRLFKAVGFNIPLSLSRSYHSSGISIIQSDLRCFGNLGKSLHSAYRTPRDTPPAACESENYAQCFCPCRSVCWNKAALLVVCKEYHRHTAVKPCHTGFSAVFKAFKFTAAAAEYGMSIFGEKGYEFLIPLFPYHTHNAVAYP